MTAGRETATADGRPEGYIPSDNTLHVVSPETEVPSPSGSAGTGDRLLDDIRGYLSSGEAREDGTVIVGGREALRIVLTRSNSTYLVDAATYEPIQLRDVGDASSASAWVARRSA